MTKPMTHPCLDLSLLPKDGAKLFFGELSDSLEGLSDPVLRLEGQIDFFNHFIKNYILDQPITQTKGQAVISSPPMKRFLEFFDTPNLHLFIPLTEMFIPAFCVAQSLQKHQTGFEKNSQNHSNLAGVFGWGVINDAQENVESVRKMARHLKEQTTSDFLNRYFSIRTEFLKLENSGVNPTSRKHFTHLFYKRTQCFKVLLPKDKAKDLKKMALLHLTTHAAESVYPIESQKSLLMLMSKFGTQFLDSNSDLSQAWPWTMKMDDWTVLSDFSKERNIYPQFDCLRRQIDSIQTKNKLEVDLPQAQQKTPPVRL